MKTDVLILAGGKSSRMGGSHKGNLIIGDETFQEHVIKELSKFANQMFLSYGVSVQCEDSRCKILMDEIPDCGPIGGLVTGLRTATNEFLAVSACDLPFIKAELYHLLYKYLMENEQSQNKKFQAVVPVADGRMHPLTAIYRKTALNDFERELREKRYKVTKVVEMMDVLYYDISKVEALRQMLQNVNTPEQYLELCKKGAENERTSDITGSDRQHT